MEFLPRPTKRGLENTQALSDCVLSITTFSRVFSAHRLEHVRLTDFLERVLTKRGDNAPDDGLKRCERSDLADPRVQIRIHDLLDRVQRRATHTYSPSLATLRQREERGKGL